MFSREGYGCEIGSNFLLLRQQKQLTAIAFFHPNCMRETDFGIYSFFSECITPVNIHGHY